jgi:signal peptidase II
MKALRHLRLALLLAIITATVGCDQTTKHFARTHLSSIDALSLPAGLGELRLAENPGSFLSLGAALPSGARFAAFTVITGAALLAVFITLCRRPGISGLNFFGLAFITAGGLSNLIDRILRHGRVTDFIYLQLGPAHTGIFNPADVLILLGVALLAFSLMKKPTPSANET